MSLNDNWSGTPLSWLRTAIRDVLLLLVVFTLICMGKANITKIETKTADLYHKKFVKSSQTFISENSGFASVEVWELDGENWMCMVSVGEYEFCNVTPSYPDDEWSKKTTQKINTNGYSHKSLDGNPEFAKYVFFIGEGYNFVKFDTARGRRVVFISQEPFDLEAMRNFIKEVELAIDLML